MGIELYEGIEYFKLAKELPSAKVGDIVSINRGDTMYLWVNGIQIEYDYAHRFPEWFTSVTLEEHRKTFEENSIKFIMEEQNVNREEAEKAFSLIFKK